MTPRWARALRPRCWEAAGCRPADSQVLGRIHHLSDSSVKEKQRAWPGRRVKFPAGPLAVLSASSQVFEDAVSWRSASAESGSERWREAARLLGSLIPAFGKAMTPQHRGPPHSAPSPSAVPAAFPRGSSGAQSGRGGQLEGGDARPRLAGDMAVFSRPFSLFLRMTGHARLGDVPEACAVWLLTENIPSPYILMSFRP